jgi:hypothetical protein
MICFLLLCYETDNLQTDQDLWNESSLSLRKMSCHFSQIHLMPIATIDGKKMHITTTAFANEYTKAIIEEFQG